MTTQQQTERDDALIADKKRLADRLWNLADGTEDQAAAKLMLEAVHALRGDEPAKPDRYQQAWDEAQGAYGQCDCDRRENCPHAVAVLRRHFAPPSEVFEAARMVKAHYSGGAYPHSITLADFILKGDQ